MLSRTEFMYSTVVLRRSEMFWMDTPLLYNSDICPLRSYFASSSVLILLLAGHAQFWIVGIVI